MLECATISHMAARRSPADLSVPEFVTALPAIACLVAPDGEVLLTNEAWRAFGERNDNPRPASEGQNYVEVCQTAAPDPYAAEVGEAIERLLDGGIDSYRTTYPCPGPEEDRWFDLLAWRLDLEEGPYLLVAHLDATSRTKGELETDREVERLEALARVLSHDLRTPLSVASGYCGLLEEETDSPNLERVQEALERIGTIAENAVVIARGAEVSYVESVRLDAIAARVWEGLDTGDAALFVDDGLTVDGDPGLVAELLDNLFRNALEHAGPEPTVVVGPLAAGDGFYVADDGPGISPEVRDEVFGIGYTTGTGTGFGLDIVERIAEAHGWQIAATESEDGGARFELVTDGE